MKRLNNFWIGFVTGIVAPAAVLVAMLLTGDFNGTFFEVLAYTHSIGYLAVLMRPALLANLAVFVFFFNLNYMKMCRGLIIATLVYAVYMLISWLILLF